MPVKRHVDYGIRTRSWRDLNKKSLIALRHLNFHSFFQIISHCHLSNNQNKCLNAESGVSLTTRGYAKQMLVLPHCSHPSLHTLDVDWFKVFNIQ